MARITLARITRVVAEEFGTTSDHLLGPVQATELSNPRHVAWGIADATGAYTDGQLAATFHRTMSTIKIGLKRLPAKLAKPAVAAPTVRACERLGVDPRRLGLSPSRPVIATFIHPVTVEATVGWRVAA